jgi:hypothetical protein
MNGAVCDLRRKYKSTNANSNTKPPTIPPAIPPTAPDERPAAGVDEVTELVAGFGVVCDEPIDVDDEVLVELCYKPG